MSEELPKVEAEFSLEDFKEKFKQFLDKYQHVNVDEKAGEEADALLNELERMLESAK